MVTMVVKCDGVIGNPSTRKVLSASIYTSDSFSGSNGDIYLRDTDCSYGGVPAKWGKIGGFPEQGVYEIENGIVKASKNGPSSGVVGLDKQFQNAGFRFKISQLSSGVRERFIDVRRDLLTTKVFRLEFSSGVIKLLYRDEGGISRYLGEVAVKPTDEVLYLANQNSHKVYVNDALKIDVIENNHIASGYISLSRGPVQADENFALDDLVILQIN